MASRGVIHAANVGASVLGGMVRANVKTNTEIEDVSTDGEPWAYMLHIREQKPGAAFSSLNVAQALGLIPPIGTPIADLVGGLELFFAKLALGATKASGAVHRKYTVTEGVIVPRRLTVDHARDAELESEAFFTYDGSNDPVVVSDLGALPTLPAVERFGMGPTTIGGVLLEGKTRLVIDFGITENVEGTDSEAWPAWVNLQEIKPSLRLEGVDHDWWSSTAVPLLGKKGTHANTSIYLRKYVDGGGFEPDASLVHTKLTVDGFAVPDDHDASGTETGRVALTMPLEHDGSNYPIVVTSGVALPP